MKLPAGAGEKDEEEEDEEEEEEDAAGAEEEVEKVATALFPVAYDGIQKSKHLSSASSNSRKRKKIVMIVDDTSGIDDRASQLQPAPANPLTLADRREKQQQQQRKKAKKKQTRRRKEDAREEKPPSNRRPSTRSLVSALKRPLRRASGGQISCLVHISYGVSWPPRPKLPPATGSQLILYFCRPFRQKGGSPLPLVLLFELPIIALSVSNNPLLLPYN
ncbi:hypothetical protein TRV_02259 [Trichophyton verrucosum HKI 0517]|uniref:Uncharacterized protein n=1 Tax=Trichophyton verrucosum (strain HKI 0517) TaxID=663202 RepID=D4D589_TRIVH|nr:uncharacterized protein TRV_02259 [Trichophyton verrucosum HKI 0517]EFE43009.1 hypothetical protein TRV_02259 [Trichophyton verrucosum HKI 0517]